MTTRVKRAGALLLTIAVVTAIAGFYWERQASRLDDLVELADSFEPPQSWREWTLLEENDQPYSPVCVDSQCPRSVNRYVAVVPDGDVTADVVGALAAISDQRTDEQTLPCDAGQRCLFSGSSELGHLTISLRPASSQAAGMIPRPQDGFTTIELTVRAE